MRAAAFWRAVTRDMADLLDRFFRLLAEEGIRYWLIGGQAVNAYADPVVSLDLVVVVAVEDLSRLEDALRRTFTVERFPHSLNVADPQSDLRIQIQTDERYSPFVSRAETREVLGRALSVARPDDLLQGKVWAALDDGRRPSKRQKDLADIARLLEGFPEMRSQVPQAILDRLI
ncbi:MAG TPA: nucleotidyl transferase AbiEii/AbiGii toxin family protein [Vicinamibacterales bacterium]|nr:nucleotidyl transferase AbiEii/AbiGii toxin family protein [Vicinamibacterales bacterium]